MTYQLDQATICRHGTVVLADLSLTLRSGQVIGLIGPNGVGKSTMLAALAGDLILEQGQVLLQGINLRHLSVSALASQRAIMAQQTAAIFNLSVRQVLELGLHVFAQWKHDNKEALLTKVAQDTDVAQWLDQSITTLSVGQQQRVHFARALLQARAAIHEHGHAWLLLDEPTANQDPWQQQMMMSVCRDVAAQGSEAAAGATSSRGSAGVLLVMHDLTLAAQWCDEIIVLRDKGVLAHGKTRDVLTPETLKRAFGHRLDVQVIWQPAPGVIMSGRRFD